MQGHLLFNGNPVNGTTKAAIGFVDQQDALMGSLTVFEAVFFSALLRLRDDLPLAAKAQRVLDVLRDLHIEHVADSYIGTQYAR